MRYVTRFGTICTIFKKVKSTLAEVLLLVKLQTFQDSACNLAKSNTPSWFFLRLLNCTIGTESSKASHMFMLLD